MIFRLMMRMVETHHVHKLDAPSGTAITLAEGLIDNIERKNKWVEGKNLQKMRSESVR